MEYAIFGGGISGLYLAFLLEQSGKKVNLFEKKGRVGGRIKTIQTKWGHYDAGANRINTNHHRVIHLAKIFGLENDWKEYPKTKFNKKINKVVEIISKKYNTKEKVNYSFDCLMGIEFGEEMRREFKNEFGYNSNLETMNAEEFIKSFNNNYTGNFLTQEKGLEILIDKLFMRKSTIKYYFEETLLKIDNTKGGFEVTTNKNKYKVKNLILMLPAESLLEIEGLEKYKELFSAVSINPYCRVFQAYKSDWFGQEKKTTSEQIRQVIPLNKNLVQSSYCNGLYAQYLRDASGNLTLEKYLNIFLTRLYKKKIPKPLYTSSHYWEAGTHFWKPGFKNNSEKMLQPNSKENLYIGGESFSNIQGWIEGALETADKIFNLLKNKKINKSKNSKYKIFSKKEVAKHNKENDAWTIIEGKVYDITKWIPNHPGGNVIMKCVGKDGTNLFEQVGHSDYAKNILKDFFIGILG